MLALSRRRDFDRQTTAASDGDDRLAATNKIG